MAECTTRDDPRGGRALQAGTRKGHPLEAARIAGIMGVKRTPDLLPFCHPIAVTGAEVLVEPDESAGVVRVQATVNDRTGAEMEALTAASVAALSLYDTAEAFDRAASIEAPPAVEVGRQERRLPRRTELGSVWGRYHAGHVLGDVQRLDAASLPAILQVLAALANPPPRHRADAAAAARPGVRRDLDTACVARQPGSRDAAGGALQERSRGSTSRQREAHVVPNVGRYLRRYLSRVGNDCSQKESRCRSAGTGGSGARHTEM